MPRRRLAPEPPPLIDLPAVSCVPDWEWERRSWHEGWRWVAGVDEAGRGPLAGPVVAAAVILPRELELEGLRDSKILPAPVREELYDRIVAQAVCWAVGWSEPEEIDRVNILQATYLAMARAVEALEIAPCGALIDGRPVRGLPCDHTALVDGDARCVSIAAASVVAKVTRDRLMRGLDERHPGYGFARHKGYTTPEHLRELRRLGPCACHRRSFAPVAELLAPPAPALEALL
jgi:ribonuclease HII